MLRTSAALASRRGLRRGLEGEPVLVDLRVEPGKCSLGHGRGHLRCRGLRHGSDGGGESGSSATRSPGAPVGRALPAPDWPRPAPAGRRAGHSSRTGPSLCPGHVLTGPTSVARPAAYGWMGVSQLYMWRPSGTCEGFPRFHPERDPDRPRREGGRGRPQRRSPGGSALRPRAWGTHSHDNAGTGTVVPGSVELQDLFDRPNQKPSMTLWLSRPHRTRRRRPVSRRAAQGVSVAGAPREPPEPWRGSRGCYRRPAPSSPPAPSGRTRRWPSAARRRRGAWVEPAQVVRREAGAHDERALVAGGAVCGRSRRGRAGRASASTSAGPGRPPRGTSP